MTTQSERKIFFQTINFQGVANNGSLFSVDLRLLQKPCITLSLRSASADAVIASDLEGGDILATGHGMDRRDLNTTILLYCEFARLRDY